jgi:hypothetical protein
MEVSLGRKRRGHGGMNVSRPSRLALAHERLRMRDVVLALGDDDGRHRLPHPEVRAQRASLEGPPASIRHAIILRLLSLDLR